MVVKHKLHIDRCSYCGKDVGVENVTQHEAYCEKRPKTFGNIGGGGSKHNLWN